MAKMMYDLITNRRTYKNSNLEHLKWRS